MWSHPYITPKEAARLLQVSVRTVRRWAAGGQLTAVRVGRQWRIPRAALERMMRTPPPREGDVLAVDWLTVCRQTRAATAPGTDSAPLLHALREERAAR